MVMGFLLFYFWWKCKELWNWSCFWMALAKLDWRSPIMTLFLNWKLKKWLSYVLRYWSILWLVFFPFLYSSFLVLVTRARYRPPSCGPRDTGFPFDYSLKLNGVVYRTLNEPRFICYSLYAMRSKKVEEKALWTESFPLNDNVAQVINQHSQVRSYILSGCGQLVSI